MSFRAMLRASVVLVCVVFGVDALDNGVARTPPLGWNSWNKFHGLVSADVLRATADRFVELGLADVGYHYINTDDCWSNRERDPKTGRIVPGLNFGGTEAAMKNLSAYIKSKGLEFGIYGAAGMTTCAGRAGGLYHERLDAQTYADWGATYLKYDDCGEVDIQSYAKFSAMRDSLNATGIPIVFSYEPHVTVPIGWPQYVGNAWRTGGDIGASYSRLLTELAVVNAWAGVTGPGQWGDADILEVCLAYEQQFGDQQELTLTFNVLQVGNEGLSLPEQRTHFALWAMVKSPLLIGCDLTTVSPEALAIMKNKALIAINQDPLGVQAVLVNSTAGNTPVTLAPGAEQRLQTIAELRQSPFPSDPAVGSGLTWCDWDPTTISPTQQITLAPSGSGVTIRVSRAQGDECLTVTDASGGSVGFTACVDGQASQQWVTTRVNETVAQITPVGSPKQCLGTDGVRMALEPCATEPAECSIKRCAESALKTQLWYHSSGTRQLISSFTNVSIPPVPKPDSTEVATAIDAPFRDVTYSAIVSACNATDPMQEWLHPKNPGPIESSSSPGLCLTAKATLTLAACDGSSSQSWDFDSQSGNLKPVSGGCADVYNFSGPVVQIEKGCKPHKPTHRGSENDEWTFDLNPATSSGKFVSNSTAECCGSPSRPIPDAGLCLTSTTTPTPPPPPPPPPPGLINIPLCMAYDLDPNPAPNPPKPPPTANPHLSHQVWAGPLANGDVAVALLNADDTGNATITAEWGDIGVAAGVNMAATDLYTGQSLGTFTGSFSASVGPHDVVVVRLTKP